MNNPSAFSGSNYPLMSQTEWDSAPFNMNDLEDNEPQEIEVTVSMTLSKTVKIKVTDYEFTVSKDEDNNPIIDYDFSQCDLKEAVKKQVSLPSDTYDRLSNVVILSEDNKSIKALQDLKDWTVDDFEVIPE